MIKSSENRSVAKQSTNTLTSAHETCEKFMIFISERYPQLQSPRFKLRKQGKRLTIRASYHRRRIFVWGYDVEKTISRFTRQIIRKVTQEKYYPNLDDLKKNRTSKRYL